VLPQSILLLTELRKFQSRECDLMVTKRERIPYKATNTESFPGKTVFTSDNLTERSGFSRKNSALGLTAYRPSFQVLLAGHHDDLTDIRLFRGHVLQEKGALRKLFRKFYLKLLDFCYWASASKMGRIMIRFFGSKERPALC